MSGAAGIGAGAGGGGGLVAGVPIPFVGFTGHRPDEIQTYAGSSGKDPIPGIFTVLPLYHPANVYAITALTPANPIISQKRTK